MRVSVVITNYNGARFLAAAIASVLAQTHSDVELVVVDDGSTDDSADVIGRFAGLATIVMKRNGGQGSAVNAGFAASTGDAVVFLDPDDELLPDAARVLAEILQDADVAKVHWPMVLIDADGRPTGEHHPRMPLDHGDLRDRLWWCPRYVSAPMSGNGYPRWVLEQVLPMPEGPFPAGADAYLYHLVIPFGEVRTAADPLSRYRKHGGSVSAQPLRARAERWAGLDDAAWQALAMLCERHGLPHDLDCWRRNSWNHRLDAAFSDLEAVVPRGASILALEDNGSLGLDAVADRSVEQWWGAPANGEEAVAELERRIREGAEYLVVGWPAYWWLAYYGGLRDFLRRFPLLLANERVRVHALASDVATPGAVPARPRQVDVFMCTYRRPERLPATLAMLGEQERVTVRLHVWNNEPAIAARVDEALATAPVRTTVHHSTTNVGGFGRFLLAREIAGRARSVVFIDDDVDLAPCALRTLLDEHRPATIGSFYAYRFASPGDYFDRVDLEPGARAHYCGTGGMVCDADAFRDPAFFVDCPERFRFVEDLWLSYYADHRLGWRLYRSGAAFHLGVDEHDQWRALKDDKSSFLRELVARGWDLGARTGRNRTAIAISAPSCR